MTLAPNNNNYLYGSGSLYFKASGDSNYLHLGNMPRLDISMVPQERIEHWENKTDKKHKDVDDTLKFNVKADGVIEEYSKENFDIIFRGDGVQALGDQSANNLDATETTIENDRYVSLGYTDLFITKISFLNASGTFTIGETVTGASSGATGKIAWRTSTYMELINVSGTFQGIETITGGTSTETATVSGVDTMPDVVVNDAASPTTRYTRGTDYDIDTIGGFLCIYSTGSASTPVYISADYAAKTNRTIRALAGTQKNGEILFIGNPRRGPRWRIQGWNVNIRLTGGVSFVSKEIGQIDIELEFLSDSDNHPSDPYFKAINAVDSSGIDDSNYIFSNIQDINTGAMDSESFDIGDDTYLAYAFNYNGVSYALQSPIYKWNGSAFASFQNLNTNGAQDIETFIIGSDTYLAVANYRISGNYVIDSNIYKWNGSIFTSLQNITTNGAIDWESFTIGSDTYLAIANFRDNSSFNINSVIYKWNGSSFAFFQNIATNGAMAMESFTIGSDTYLAICNHYNGVTRQINSVIYKWNGSSFAFFQNIATKGAHDFRFFDIDGSKYLAVANQYDDSDYTINSVIYKWNGSSFAEYQTINTDGATGLRFFEINNNSYLAIANYYNNSSYDINSWIYKWNGSLFQLHQEIATTGARDIRFFEIDSESYISISHHRKDAGYAVVCPIFQWVPS